MQTDYTFTNSLKLLFLLFEGAQSKFTFPAGGKNHVAVQMTDESFHPNDIWIKLATF
jgi:hypothetical protein